MSRPKEIFEERTQTTVRLAKELLKSVKRRCIDVEIDQNDAISAGLELWLAYQDADQALKVQVDDAVKRMRKRRLASVGDTTTKGSRTGTTG